MKKLFPVMSDRPETGTVIGGSMYWGVCYVLIPFVTTVMLIGSYGDISMVAGMDLAYFVLNFLIIGGMFFQYLRDSFLIVQLYTKKYIITALITAVIIAVLMLHTAFTGYMLGIPMAFSVYPVTETSVLTSSAATILTHPVAGMIIMVLLAPVTVSCMYYATVFAPFCTRRPWLAYLILALALMVPRIFNIWWLGNAEYELWTYFLHLPVHILACWSFQKTDTVWTPITVLSLANLISGLTLLMMGRLGLIGVK